MIHDLKIFLGQPISSEPLVIFRFLFGLALCISFVRKRKTLIDYFSQFDFHFKYTFFQWVKPLGKRGMSLTLDVLIITLALFACGLFYHTTSLVAFGLFTYIFLIDKARYNNHYYLIALFLFLFNFIDASNESKEVPYWHLLILQLQLLIAYTYAGINKINAEWLIHAEPMHFMLKDFKGKTQWDGSPWHYCYNRSIEHSIQRQFQNKKVAVFFSWAGMLFDLLIIWLMLIPGLLPFVLPIFILFHLFNLWFFQIGIFPYFNFITIVLFL
ncbi:MAG: HTTM domain-containing protein [Chlamydiota bacterium]|nr:HTTM domain-containing protein [Chlamydiota bacterium]